MEEKSIEDTLKEYNFSSNEIKKIMDVYNSSLINKVPYPLFFAMISNLK